MGELLRFLERSPEWANTYVIITADHGEGFGEHGTYTHGWNLYREVLHVPLIIAGPGIPAGVRITDIARTRQIFTTALELAGVKEAVLRRTSLSRLWDPGYAPSNPDEPAISEVLDNFALPAPQGMISITTREWQLIYRPGYQRMRALSLAHRRLWNSRMSPISRRTNPWWNTSEPASTRLSKDPTGPGATPATCWRFPAPISPQISKPSSRFNRSPGARSFPQGQEQHKPSSAPTRKLLRRITRILTRNCSGAFLMTARPSPHLLPDFQPGFLAKLGRSQGLLEGQGVSPDFSPRLDAAGRAGL